MSDECGHGVALHAWCPQCAEDIAVPAFMMNASADDECRHGRWLGAFCVDCNDMPHAANVAHGRHTETDQHP